jgi:hypothetical protein
VDQATLRALARTPADRFATAADFSQSLRVGGATPTGTRVISASTASSRHRPGVLVGLGLLVTAGAGAAWLKARAPTPVPVDSSAFAVLPFRAVGPGLDLWREGLVDLLAINLDGAGGLRAIPPRTVLSRWHREIAAGEADEEQALAVARGVGARYALTGSIVGSGPSLRLTAELRDLEANRLAGRAQAEGPGDSVPAMVDRLTLQLLSAGLPAAGGETSSLERLRDVAARYPDDAESWFLLGDALYHIGGAAFQPREAYRQALGRATVLDPTFAPPYLHLAEDAFDRLDSVEVGRIVKVLREIEPASPKTTGLGLMRDLIWGSETEKARAVHSLDTATAFAVLTAKHATNVTLDLADYTIRVGNALGDQTRHPKSERAQGKHGVAMVYEMRGQIEEAKDRWVESWKLGGRMTSEEIAANVHYWFYLLNGFAGIGDSLGAAGGYAFFAGLADSVVAPDAGVVGLYAAHSGRWQDLDRWVRVANEGAQAATRAGDSIAGRRYAEGARVLAALLAEHRGKAGAATAELERAMKVYPGPAGTPGSTMGSLLRFDLGRRYLASGDFRAARRQLESFYSWDFAPNALFGILELQRGQVAEGLGELEQAKVHYGNVVRWWKDCDPDARRVFDEARSGLVRLTGEPVAVSQ